MNTRKARSYINSDRRFPVTNCEQATTACITRAIYEIALNIFLFFFPFDIFVFNYVLSSTKSTPNFRFNLTQTVHDTTNFRLVAPCCLAL